MVAAAKNTLRVQEVLRHYVPDYLLQHEVSRHKSRIIERLGQCRSRALGGQRWGCGACCTRRFRYHSCRNLHCPTCNDTARLKWLDQMLEDQLPVRYSHVVFTVPHELLPLFHADPRAMFDLFYAAVAFAMESYAKKYHGIKLGFIMVLHTWGQRLNAHPHVHVLLVLGGLGLKNKGNAGDWENGSWVSVDDPNELIGGKTLAHRFRDRFLKRLRLLVANQEIRLTKNFDTELISESGKLAKKGWYVRVQSPPEKCQGAEGALRYLAAYIKGAPISDRRLISDEGGVVTFSIKDYRAGMVGDAIARDNVAITGEEFVRRSLFHFLPHRFRRARKRGFLASQSKKSLARVRHLLGAEKKAEPETRPVESFAGDSDLGNDIEGNVKIYAPTCPECGKEMSWQGEIQPEVDWVRGRHRHFMIAFCAALRAREILLQFPRPP